MKNTKTRIYILLPFFILVFPSCSIKSNSKSDTDSLGQWEILDKEFYTKQADEYNVIVTSRTCRGCEYLQDALLSYQSKMTDKEISMVFTFDVTNNSDLTFIDDEALVLSQKGNSDVYATLFYVTPSLYKITNNQLSEVITDYSTIRSFLLETVNTDKTV